MKKRKWIGTVLFCVIVAVAVIVTLWRNKTPVVTCDSFEIKLGKTKVEDIYNAGFTDKYSNVEKPGTIKSLSLERFYLAKDGLEYGTLYVGNKTKYTIDYEDGVIFQITVSYDSGSSLGTILIDGVNYENYTRDEIMEVMKDKTPTLDTDKYLRYQVGKGEYTFSFEEGSDVVSSVKVTDGTEIEYGFQR